MAAYTTYITSDVVGDVKSISSADALSLSQKFQSVCADVSSQMFDQDMTQYVDFNIGGNWGLKHGTANNSGYTYKYNYTYSNNPPYTVIKSEQPTTPAIGQYADYLTVADMAFDKKICPENGQTNLMCKTCSKPYMNLFEENTGSDYCGCNG